MICPNALQYVRSPATLRSPENCRSRSLVCSRSGTDSIGGADAVAAARSTAAAARNRTPALNIDLRLAGGRIRQAAACGRARNVDAAANVHPVEILPLLHQTDELDH